MNTRAHPLSSTRQYRYVSHCQLTVIVIVNHDVKCTRPWSNFVGVRDRNGTLLGFRGCLTLASRPAQRTTVYNETDGIVRYINTMIELAKRREVSSGRIVSRKRVGRLSAPSNSTHVERGS